MQQVEIEIFPENATIKFFKNPDDLTNGTYAELSVKEVEEMFKKQRNIDSFKWTNNPYLPSKNSSLDMFQHSTLPSPEKKLDLNNLGICYLNDSIGYGVVTTKKIHKGEWMLFNGETLTAWSTDILENNCYISFISQANYIDAKNKGGFSSLILASIHEDFLSSIRDKYNSSLQRLGTANFEARTIIVKGITQLVVEAKRDIEPYEVLFSDYGKSYFLQFTGEFQVLNRDGTLAAPEIQRDINHALEQYILNRNKSRLSSGRLKSIAEKNDQAQLDNRKHNFPRVFLNSEIFIVYPNAYADFIECIEAAIQEKLYDTAHVVLKFIMKLNEKYNNPLEQEKVMNQLQELKQQMDTNFQNEQLEESKKLLAALHH